MPTDFTNSAAPSATSRDGYIMIQVPLHGVASIQSLLPERQVSAAEVDMCALVRATTEPKPRFWGMVWGVESLVGKEIELWPNSEGMTKQDRIDRLEMRTWIGVARRKLGSLVPAYPIPQILALADIPTTIEN